MIIGIGTDLVDIARIAKVYDRFGMAFVRKIIAESEMNEYVAHGDPVRFLAKRFAVKEAAAKALGSGMRAGIWFRDFVVSHTPEGQPLLTFEGAAKRLAMRCLVKRLHLSVSDERGSVVAFVILEG